MLALLNDKNTYTPISSDLTNSVSKKIDSLIKNLKNDSKITEEQYKKMCPKNAVTPKIYGLVKIHKGIQYPLRPIVSFIGSPCYGLGKFMAQILRDMLPRGEYEIINSLNLKQHINNRVIPRDMLMVSLDVVSLFSKISLDLIKSSLRHMWSKYRVSPEHNFTLDVILEIVELMNNSSYFVFDKTFYRQISGMPMGSPISPILASFCMEYVIDAARIKSNDLLGTDPQCVFIYVDDLFCLMPRTHVTDMVDIFNSIHADIKFTHEIETEGRLSYLDLQVIRCGDELVTNWYCKSYCSNRLINYNSSHNFKQKIAVIKNLKYRIFSLSDDRFEAENKKRFRDICRLNDYPDHIINCILHRPLATNTTTSTAGNIKYHAFPDIFPITVKLNRLLKPFNVKLGCYNKNKINNIYTKLKDKTDDNNKSSLVYSIPCKDCKLSYIGTTGNKLNIRLQQHRNDCKPKYANHNKTALSNHHFNTGHTFDFVNAKVLESEANFKKRLIAETLHIKKNKKTIVNFKTDSEQLFHYDIFFSHT